MAVQSFAYLCRFTLPDGEHLMAVYASDDLTAHADFRKIINRRRSNIPDEPVVILEIRRCEPEDLITAAEELKQRDPTRPLAPDMFDVPNRILYERVTPGTVLDAPGATGDVYEDISEAWR